MNIQIIQDGGDLMANNVEQESQFFRRRGLYKYG